MPQYTDPKKSMARLIAEAVRLKDWAQRWGDETQRATSIELLQTTLRLAHPFNPEYPVAPQQPSVLAAEKASQARAADPWDNPNNNAYHAGYQACMESKPITDNPHDPKTYPILHEYWNAGWTDASGHGWPQQKTTANSGE